MTGNWATTPGQTGSFWRWDLKYAHKSVSVECQRVCAYLYVCVCVCVRVSACGWLWGFVCVSVHFVCVCMHVCERERVCVWTWVCECVHVWSYACERERVRERESVCLFYLSDCMHTLMRTPSFSHCYLLSSHTCTHAMHSLDARIPECTHIMISFFLSSFFSLSLPLFLTCFRLFLRVLRCVCVCVCIWMNVFAYAYSGVRVCACVPICGRECKGKKEWERKCLWDCIVYLTACIYAERSLREKLWVQRCACKCVQKQDDNKSYQHPLSLLLHMCLWVCKRQRETERQRAKKCMRTVSLSLHIIRKHIYTHSCSLKLLSLTHTQKHACHAHVGCMHAYAFYPETYPLSLFLCLNPSFSLQSS